VTQGTTFGVIPAHAKAVWKPKNVEFDVRADPDEIEAVYKTMMLSHF